MNNQGIVSRNVIKPITPSELGKQKIKPNEVKETLDMCGLTSISPNQTPLVFLICTISKMPMFSTTTGENNYENIAKFYNYVISNYPYILEELGPEVTSAEKLKSKLQEIYKILETSAKGFDDTLDPYEISLLNHNSHQFGNVGGKRKNKLTKNKKFKIKSKSRLEKKLGKIIRNGKKSPKRKYKRKSKKRKSKRKSIRKSIKKSIRRGGGQVSASISQGHQQNVQGPGHIQGYDQGHDEGLGQGYVQVPDQGQRDVPVRRSSRLSSRNSHHFINEYSNIDGSLGQGYLESERE